MDEYSPLPATPDETQSGIDDGKDKSTTGKQAGGGIRHAIIATVRISPRPGGRGTDWNPQARKSRREGQGDR